MVKSLTAPESRGGLFRWLRRSAALAIAFLLIAFTSHSVPVGAQIPGALNVSLSASPTTAAVGQLVSFTLSASPPAVLDGRLTSVALDYGDGARDDISGPFGPGERVTRTRNHAYTAAGTYTATVTATASNGDSNSDSQTITVSGGGNQPPIGGLTVNLTASPPSVSAGQLVSYTASASPPSVLGGRITSIMLDYGDGVTADLGGSSIPGEQVTRTTTHAYASSGTYTAILTATASNGQTGSASQTVFVSGGNQPPIGGLTVNLAASPSSVSAGQLVSYTASASPPSVLGGTITSMLLDFGDGTTADLGGSSTPGQQVTRTTTHSYAVSGTYTATLTATASNGQTNSSSQTVFVTGGNQPPIGGLNVTLTASPITVQAGQLVTFNGSAQPPSVLGGSIIRTTLDFGDGTTADLGNGAPGQVVTPTTTHSYALAGTYTATLTATASNGQTNSASQTITVFGVTPTPTPGGMPINYVAGWNLVAGPSNTVVSGNSGPLYTYQAGNTAYQVIQPGTALTAGQGYWAFFNNPATSTIPFIGPQTISVSLPALQWVMIGNPGSTPATVTGADTVYTYATGPGYQATTTLQPGQGAWAISLNGGTVTIRNQ